MIYRPTILVGNFGGRSMKATYDRHTDTLTIEFRTTPTAASDEDKPGVVAVVDDAGNLVSLEVLNASTRVHDAGIMDFKVEG